MYQYQQVTSLHGWHHKKSRGNDEQDCQAQRSQTQAPKVSYKGQFQKGSQFYKPKNEHEVPNTLAPTNIVDENPWCLECSEAHWEHECPYNTGHQQVNNMDCFMEFPQINITDAEHQEAMKEAARSTRMAVINNLDQES
jgi:hypothetical protein